MVTCQVLRRACLLKQISPDGSVYVVIDRLVIDLESRPSGTAILKLTEIVDTSGLPHLRRPHEQHGRSEPDRPDHPQAPNAISEFAIPTAASTPRAIATGPDGNLWFLEMGANKIPAVEYGKGSPMSPPTAPHR